MSVLLLLSPLLLPCFLCVQAMARSFLDEGGTLSQGFSLETRSIHHTRYSLVAEAGGLVLYAKLEGTPAMRPCWTCSYHGSRELWSIIHTCDHPTFLAIERNGTVEFRLNRTVPRVPSSTQPNRTARVLKRSFVLANGLGIPRCLELLPDGRVYYDATRGAWTSDFSLTEPIQCLLDTCGWNGICDVNATSIPCECPPFFTLINPSHPTEGCHYLEGAQQHSEQLAAYLLQLPCGTTYFSNPLSPPHAGAATLESCRAACLANDMCTAVFFDEEKKLCQVVQDPVGTMVLSSNKAMKGFAKVYTAKSSFLWRRLVATPGETINGSDISGVIAEDGLRCSARCAITISGIVASVLLLLIAAWLIWVIWTKRRQSSIIALDNKHRYTISVPKNASEGKTANGVQVMPNHKPGDDESFLLRLSGVPIRFCYKQLQAATDNFSHKLGSGGCATVYRGALGSGSNRHFIAVKALEKAACEWANPSQARDDFRTEVATICSVHHFNLVRLVGFCSQGGHRLLVYEFMSNGSLDRWLFSSPTHQAQDKQAPLEWSVRFRIAMDTAQGLAYLHDKCKKKIIHLDIKPENILLDNNFAAKIADFGLCKLLKREQATFVTKARGTPGYVAPEFLWAGEDSACVLTDKCDVYSYGAVLLEIVGGRRNFDPTMIADDGTVSSRAHFPRWAFLRWREGRLSEIVDPRLNGEYDEAEANRMVTLAFWCMQESPHVRPRMTKLVQMLEGLVQISDKVSSPLHLTLGAPAECSSMG